MDLKVSNQDLASPVWRRFTQELRKRLEHLRELNDNASHSETKTALIRGQISEVKKLLALQPSATEHDIPQERDVHPSQL